MKIATNELAVQRRRKVAGEKHDHVGKIVGLVDEARGKQPLDPVRWVTLVRSSGSPQAHTPASLDANSLPR